MDLDTYKLYRVPEKFKNWLPPLIPDKECSKYFSSHISQTPYGSWDTLCFFFSWVIPAHSIALVLMSKSEFWLTCFLKKYIYFKINLFGYDGSQ